jgi:low affinity Fe/Cu permease
LDKNHGGSIPIEQAVKDPIHYIAFSLASDQNYSTNATKNNTTNIGTLINLLFPVLFLQMFFLRNTCTLIDETIGEEFVKKRRVGFYTIAITHSKDKEDLASKLGADSIVSNGDALKQAGGADVILVTSPCPKTILYLL